MWTTEEKRKTGRLTVISLSFLFLAMSGHPLNAQQNTDVPGEINTKELISELQFDAKSGIFYYIHAEQENIKINLRFMDEIQQKKVLLYGLYIYVDPKNKTKKNLSIKYPLGQVSQQDNMTLRLNYNELKALAVQPMQEIEMSGFVGKNELSYSFAQNNEGIYGTLEFDEMGSMFYQLIIPVNEVPGMQLDQDFEFSIGIETGHQTVPPSYSAMEQMGGRSEGGGRAGAGGRGGSGGKGGSRGSGQSTAPSRDAGGMAQADKFWIKDLTINSQ